MKAVILAAGSGNRMGKYTENLPKGMLSFNGKPLIEWQISQLRRAGISDIIIITGYMREKINYPGVTYFHNEEYSKTNMIETLLCAREILNSDLLVCYSDIIYTGALLRLAIASRSDVGVSVDSAWRGYWLQRYGSTETDLESLVVKNGKITEIGQPVSSSAGINYRYIGLNKFSAAGIGEALRLYDEKKAKNESWLQSRKTFKNGYMTDLLHELIQRGVEVQPIVTSGGWLEFDTCQDYDVTCELLKSGAIDGGFFNC